MVIYNALPRKEYERIFMCNTAKDIWKTLLITHQVNNQVKDNKINLLVQQYEQFVIFEDEYIDSAIARFNTIITSLKALDEGYSSKNYVRKFIRALHPKWREKVTAIEESKDLTSLSLDELIGNLKFHWMIIKKDSKIVKAKGEKRSLALKAKKESSDEECSTFGSEDEEYAIATFQRSRDDKNDKSERMCFRCGDPNHLIGECPKPLRDKNQRAFVGGSWSDSGEEDDEKIQDEACLAAQAPNEGIRKKGLYVMKLGNKPKEKNCLATIDENSTLWHRRLGHTNMHLIQSLASKELVRNLPKLKFDQHFCDACKIGKQAHTSHKAKNIVSKTRCIELLQMDLFGPSVVRSCGGDRFILVIVDDYSRKIKESLNVTFNETPLPSKTSPLVDDDLDEEEAIKIAEKKNIKNVIEDETLEIDEIVNIKESRNHPLENVIGNLNQRTLRSQAQNQKLNQFIANDVQELVPQPRNMKIIGTKWVFRNKLDENGVVSRNKARLVAQGYNQHEGIYYDETYAPVARLESIRILLAYACALDFELFQMDVKTAFLNSFINEEVYVAQPPGFIEFEKPNHVYKLKKAFYGLKQAPKAWYNRLKAFLIKHEYKIGMVDNTLFTKNKSSNLIIVQIYVDDIIFGSTCQDMCDEFSKIMHDEFKMSMMGELNYFFGLQIKQIEDGIFFNQSKYIKEMLKKFGLEDSKPMKTPMSLDTKLTKYKCELVDSTKYRGIIEFTQILDIPCEAACVFTDRWSLDELAYDVLSKGPYQTNLPSPDDIVSYIREDREGQVTCIHHKKEIEVQDYQILTRKIMSTLKPLEEIIQEFLLLGGAQKERKTRKDFSTRRGRHSTSSFSAFDQPSSSHLNKYDDGNDEGTSRANTPSPIRYVNSLTNEVPQVFQNPPNIDPDLEPFYTRQIEIINRQV
nr:copia protein [Tanacetum cinerariifolium]